MPYNGGVTKKPEPASLLRTARKRRNEKQEDIATRLGVTQPTVSNWERGAMPHPSMWAAIAEAYGLSLAAVTRLYRDEAA